MSNIIHYYYQMDAYRGVSQYRHPIDSPLGRTYAIPSMHIFEDYVYLWPRRSGIMGDFAYASMDILQPRSILWEQPYRESGKRGCYIITGRTLDANGAVLSGVTVDCFTASDDVKRGTTTSDSQGNYYMSTESSAAHYLVAYKDGSPDVFGTTVDTIVPV